jgi:hypothetical protein
MADALRLLEVGRRPAQRLLGALPRGNVRLHPTHAEGSPLLVEERKGHREKNMSSVVERDVFFNAHRTP